jgi:tight adherence protein B
MDPAMFSILIGVGVVVLIGGLGLVMGRSSASVAEQRLDGLSGKRSPAKAEADSAALLKAPAIDFGKSQRWLDGLLSVEGLSRLYEQADVGFSFRRFLAVCGGLALAGVAVSAGFGLPILLWPVSAACLAALPFLWLVMRRKKRIAKFIAQMPDAMELVARALRAGHGLASGLHVVADEMPPPIAHEFGRVFEEQNLGIPMEEALRGLSDRVPTMDVRFFVTAVIIQRATGGDLAEILDKIGRLIRERFQILGQVQALTGEGRVSGAVLLAMPPALLAFTYAMNPDYVGLLFNTDIGKKMLVVTAILQLVGAAAIKKIITIKV